MCEAQASEEAVELSPLGIEAPMAHSILPPRRSHRSPPENIVSHNHALNSLCLINHMETLITE